MKSRLVIGTRGSRLALTQTEQVAARLRELAPGLEVEVRVIRTTGDRILDTPLAQIGDKGLFTKELETALLDGAIDLAVHSLKDLPTALPAGLQVGAVPAREVPNDALVCARWPGLEALPQGARVGTSSPRRAAQLRAFRPDLEIVDLRGNVDTRVGRVTEGRLDAAVLACAGLRRLGMERAIRETIPFEILVPAVGQGALAVESRSNDEDLAGLLDRLTDTATQAEVLAERACLDGLGGGCQIPLGAIARAGATGLTLLARVCSLNGKRNAQAETQGPIAAAADIGRRAAEMLLRDGAMDLIEAKP